MIYFKQIYVPAPIIPVYDAEKYQYLLGGYTVLLFLIDFILSQVTNQYWKEDILNSFKMVPEDYKLGHALLPEDNPPKEVYAMYVEHIQEEGQITMVPTSDETAHSNDLLNDFINFSSFCYQMLIHCLVYSENYQSLVQKVKHDFDTEILSPPNPMTNLSGKVLNDWKTYCSPTHEELSLAYNFFTLSHYDMKYEEPMVTNTTDFTIRTVHTEPHYIYLPLKYLSVEKKEKTYGRRC